MFTRTLILCTMGCLAHILSCSPKQASSGDPSRSAFFIVNVTWGDERGAEGIHPSISIEHKPGAAQQMGEMLKSITQEKHLWIVNRLEVCRRSGEKVMVLEIPSLNEHNCHGPVISLQNTLPVLIKVTGSCRIMKDGKETTQLKFDDSGLEKIRVNCDCEMLAITTQSE